MNRSIFIQFGIAFVALLVAGGGWMWWSAHITAMHTHVEALSTSIQEKQMILARAATTRAELASLTSDKITINSYFVSESDIVTFLNVLEATGRASGATVSIVSVAPHKDTKYPMLNVSTKIVGSFDAVLRTVGAIENIPYYVITKSLSLSTSKTPVSGTNKGPWSAELILSVGYTSSTTNSTTTP